MIMKLNILSKLRKKDVVDFKETQYLAVVNDTSYTFDDKKLMLKFIEDYTKSNVIYSLNMFKCDLYNLIS